MFRVTILENYRCIVDTRLNTLNATKDIINFRFKNTHKNSHSHQKKIVPEFSKVGDNGFHVSNLRVKLNFIILHFDI